MDEKRRYPREPFKHPVSYRVIAEKSFGGCLGCDLSAGGIKFRSNDFIPLGKELSLSLQLDREKLREVKGQVVWVQEIPFSENYYVGLKFSTFA